MVLSALLLYVSLVTPRATCHAPHWRAQQPQLSRTRMSAVKDNPLPPEFHWVQYVYNSEERQLQPRAADERTEDGDGGYHNMYVIAVVIAVRS